MRVASPHCSGHRQSAKTFAISRDLQARATRRQPERVSVANRGDLRGFRYVSNCTVAQ